MVFVISIKQKMKRLGFATVCVVFLTTLALCGTCFEQCVVPPVQLLESDENGYELKIAKEALVFLHDPHHAKRPVIPITVVGPAKSGKSFFLGMVTGCRKLFPLGHTLQAETQGAIMFAFEKSDIQSYNHDGSDENIVTLPNENNKPLYLFIDTEGLGLSLMIYDKAILLFSTLVSSHMVYHLSHTITEYDILQLHSIASLVQDFKKKGLVSELALPNLTWVVDKFTSKNDSDDFKNIDLTTKEGALQYLLEHRLKEIPNPTGNEIIQQYNDVVNVVHHEFPSQSAFFIHPAVNDDNKKKELDTISVKDMDPRYLTQIDSVKKLLLKTQPKHLHKDNKDEPMTCEGLADFIEKLIPVINENRRPLVGDLVMEMNERQAHEKAVSKYHEIMDNLTLPLDQKDFDSADESARNESIRVFEDSGLHGKIGFVKGYQKLKQQLTVESKKYRQNNAILSESLCKDIHQKVKEEMKRLYDKDIHHDELHQEIARIMQEVKDQIKGPRLIMCLYDISKDMSEFEEWINWKHEGHFTRLMKTIKKMFS